MSKLVITTEEELVRLLRTIFGERSNPKVVESDSNDKMNQKQAAAFIGVTQSTIIRYKRDNRIPYEQLPNSTKVTYYKSQLKAALQRNPDLLK